MSIGKTMAAVLIISRLATANSTNSGEAALQAVQVPPKVFLSVTSTKSDSEVEFLVAGQSGNIALSAEPGSPRDSVLGRTPGTMVVDLAKGPVEVVSRTPMRRVSIMVTSSLGEITASAGGLEIKWQDNAVVVRGI
jgi:hypothetical protein